MKIEELPRPANYRRQMAKNGGYEMVPAYTAEEVLGILEGVKKDAVRWSWLVSDCDGNAQDDFTQWLAFHVASKDEINARADAAIKKGQV